MNKEKFIHSIDNIDIPVEKLVARERMAMFEAKKKIRKGTKSSILIACGICLTLIGSGFVVPQMNHVLAKMPIIGELFSYFKDSVGENLAASQLVQEINQRAVSNGVGVTVNGVYYDGGRISVTFKVDHFRPKSKEFWYDVKIADGSDKWERGAQYDGRVTSEGFVGQILIDYPNKNLPQHLTLPLTFTSMNDIKGKWRFDIPIQQLDNKKVSIRQLVQSNDKAQKVNFETMTIGKGSAVIDYTAIHSLIGKSDLARIEKVTDDKGKEIDVLSSGIEFGRKKVDNWMESEERSIIAKIPDNTKFLMIFPYVREYEHDATHSLSEPAFKMHSTRNDVTLTVEQMEQSKNELTIQYTLDHVDTNLSLGEIKNFGENLNLIDSSQIGKDRPSIGHIVKGSTVKVLDKDKLQFQATFKLGGEYGIDDFSLENYSLEAPFSILLPEKTLPPIKVNLK